MSEKEGGDSKFLTGFLLGFLAGVLVALGVGASLLVVGGARQARVARAAEMRAVEEARAVAAMREEEEAARAAGLAERDARDAALEIERARERRNAEGPNAPVRVGEQAEADARLVVTARKVGDKVVVAVE